MHGCAVLAGEWTKSKKPTVVGLESAFGEAPTITLGVSGRCLSGGVLDDDDHVIGVPMSLRECIDNARFGQRCQGFIRQPFGEIGWRVKNPHLLHAVLSEHTRFILLLECVVVNLDTLFGCLVSCRNAGGRLGAHPRVVQVGQLDERCAPGSNAFGTCPPGQSFWLGCMG
jgi:hypothetical protein